LDVSRLRSYELGSAGQRLVAVKGAPLHNDQREEKPTVSRQAVDVSQRLDELSRACEALQNDMLHVQHLACIHDERLSRLELSSAPDH
jgi:hypothetical protein